MVEFSCPDMMAVSTTILIFSAHQMQHAMLLCAKVLTFFRKETLFFFHLFSIYFSQVVIVQARVFTRGAFFHLFTTVLCA